MSRGKKRRRRIQRAFRRAHRDYRHWLFDWRIYSCDSLSWTDFDWAAFDEGARERYV